VEIINRIKKSTLFFYRQLKGSGLNSKFSTTGKTFSFLAFLFLFIFFSPDQAHGQRPIEPIPDGTQGEILDTTTIDTSVSLDNFKYWYKFDGPVTNLQFGGGFLYEYAAYIQDDVSKEQISMEPAFQLRDMRITMMGRIKNIKREITWKFGLMYDGNQDSWWARETGVLVNMPEISGRIFIGRTKEGFSLNKIMVGYAGWSMERQMGIDIIPILADGIKYMGYLPKQRILWNVGIFADYLSKNQSFSTYSWQSVIRIGWLPVLSADGKTVLHIAANGRYGKPEDGKIRVRSRPQVSPAPYFVETEVFPADHSIHYGGEAYFSSGSFMIGSEYYAHKFTSQEKNDPLFHGGEVMLSYIFTGENRPYRTTTGVYGFVPVKKSVFDGGPGAWEAVLQFSNINLNGGTLTGGKFWRISPIVNWYLSDNVRMEFVYGYGILDRYNKEGATNFFQSRIQLML
jgi:phosphate-selective porin OprO/OprP